MTQYIPFLRLSLPIACVHVQNTSPSQIKSMAQYLNRLGKLNGPRRDQFSVEYTQNLQKLVGDVAVEICEKHIKVCTAHDYDQE